MRLNLRTRLSIAFGLVAVILGAFGLVALETLANSLGRLDSMLQVTTTANQISVLAGNSSVGPIKDLQNFSVGDQKAGDRVKVAVIDLGSSIELLRGLLPTKAERDSLDGLANMVESVREDFNKCLDGIRRDSGILLAGFFWGTAGLIAAVLAFVFWYLRVALKPLKDIARELDGLSQGQGDLTRRLKVNTGGEIGHLADRFDAFLDMMAQMLRSVRDSSHTGREIEGSLALLLKGIQECQAQIQGTGEAFVAIQTTVNRARTGFQAVDDRLRVLESGGGRVADFLREVKASGDRASEGLKDIEAREISRLGNENQENIYRLDGLVGRFRLETL
jgi:methyl-accepting chemotaxis protein